jgi:hypothetical protein
MNNKSGSNKTKIIKVSKQPPKLMVKSIRHPNFTQNSIKVSEEKIGQNIKNKSSKPPKIKRALLIGISYTNTDNQIASCAEDIGNLKNFLSNNNFKEDEITVMNDSEVVGETNDLSPTKTNIMKQLNNLITFANDHKNNRILLFLAYAGHGAYSDDKDDKSEAICPLDFKESGFIIDEEIREQFIDQLPSNVKLFMLFDSFFSENVCNLKYSYKVDPKNTITAAMKLSQTKTTVVLISNYRDESKPNNKYQGTINKAFIANYKKKITYAQLITNMRAWLQEQAYSQVPQLVSGKVIDIDSSFNFC